MALIVTEVQPWPITVTADTNTGCIVRGPHTPYQISNIGTGQVFLNWQSGDIVTTGAEGHGPNQLLPVGSSVGWKCGTMTQLFFSCAAGTSSVLCIAPRTDA